MPVRPSIASSASSPTFAARGCGTAFLSVFAMMGMVFLVLAGRSVLSGTQPYFWPAIPCTIVESQRTQPGLEPSGSSDARILIRYRYEAGGDVHVSDRLSIGAGGSRDTHDIERLLYEHPAGRRTQCWVNPANPAESVLVRGSLWSALILLVPLLFVAFGVGGIGAIWRAKRLSVETKPVPVRGNWGLRLCFGFFLAIGGAAFCLMALRPAMRMLAARGWPSVPCEIESSRVKSHSDSDGASYSVDILYRYRIGGRDFRADRYDFAGGSSSGSAGKSEIVRRHPAGSQVVCFVNPEDPTDAVLDRGFRPVMWFGLLPLVFVVIGVVGLSSTLRKPRAEPRIETGSHGSVELEPTASPLAKLLGSIAIAAFWNGIVSVFLWQLISDWRQGRHEWFLGVFLIPFVLVGLLMLGLVCNCLLNLFNPRVRLIVGSAAIPPGAPLDVRWSCGSGAGRIRRLCIAVEGREQTPGKSGKLRVLARIPLVETDDSEHIRAGSARAAIPADAQPTSDNDGGPKIVWVLTVRGEIAGFPNVTDEFPITILPRADA